MGLEDEIEVTDDIGTADAILASRSEMKQNPWIRGVAKFYHLPIFVIKVCSFLLSFSILNGCIIGTRYFNNFITFLLAQTPTNDDDMCPSQQLFFRCSYVKL